MRFVDAVRLSTQDPFGGSMQFLETLGYDYGGDAYVFSAIAHGDQDRHPDFREALFRSEPYNEHEQSLYESLSDGAKEEVLGFETVLLHELTHQIDTLATPIAALLHMWQVEEYIRLVPAFISLDACQALDFSEPIARSVVRAGHPVREALRESGHLPDIEQLLAETSQLRAFDGVGPSDIAPGWLNDQGQIEAGRIQFFDDLLEPVSLLGNIRTIRVPGARPVTLRSVLETHALSNCVRHILWRFRENPEIGAREAVRYLQCFYPLGLADEYRFVFDALSRFCGYADFEAALEGLASTSITSLDQIPVFAGLLAWAALHSTQPTERLVYLADYLGTSLRDGKHFDAPLDVLRHLDREAGQLPMAAEALELSHQLVREQQSRVPPEPGGLADHFLSMLKAVEQEMRMRIDRGFELGDPVGTPNQGNPARYLTTDQVDQFGGRYRPDAAYDSWRQLRTLLMARRCPTPKKRDALSKWVSSASAA